MYAYRLLNQSYWVQTWTMRLQTTGSKGPVDMERGGWETGWTCKNKWFIMLFQMKPSCLERKRREAKIELSLRGDSTRFISRK